MCPAANYLRTSYNASVGRGAHTPPSGNRRTIAAA